MNIGPRIKQLREENGLSQRGTARIAKMAPGVLNRIEKKGSDPRLSSLIKIAEAIGVSLVELFAEEESQPREGAA